jgi:phosphoglycerate dehydrogenase-like enzyme
VKPLRVLLTGPIPSSYEERYRNAIRSGGVLPEGSVELEVPTSADYARLVRTVADADVLFVNGAGSFGYHEVPVDRPVIEAGRKLKLIQRIGRVTRSIDLSAAQEKKVPVATCLPVGVVAIAEHAFALMLALRRRLMYAHGLAATADNPAGFESVHTTETAFVYNWARLNLTSLGTIHGTTLGLIGFGETARQVALRAVAFGMRVRYTSRHRATEEEERRHSAEFSPLPDLLSESDVVLLHVPFTKETEHLIDAEAVERMKSTAILINTSRGRVVDEQALTSALHEGRIAGAGLDVLAYEPPFPGTELLTLSNVIVTPHIATAAGPDRLIREVRVMFENVRRLMTGEPLIEVVS